MGKNRTGHISKESTKYQKLVNENKKLKRENSRLLKEIERCGDGSYCPGCLESEQKQEVAEAVEIAVPSPKVRPCFKCGDDHGGEMEMVKYTRAGEEYYFRKCSKCPHRTRGKKYTLDVKD